MDVFKEWQRSRDMVQLLIIRLLCCLGWLCSVASAQVEFNKTVTGSVSLTNVGIICVGNFAVFITSLIRGRFDLEIGVRDIMAIMRSPKLENINGLGLTTCREYRHASVLMLSTHKPHSSIRDFMKYISNAHGLHSILLQCLPLESATVIDNCNCSEPCGCIVFKAVEEITVMLARQVPGTLKRLPGSLCLLPSLHCRSNGCHGCNRGLLQIDTDESGRERLTETDNSIMVAGESPLAVCETLDKFQRSIRRKRLCICIPIHPAGDDDWAKLLIRSAPKYTEAYSSFYIVVLRLIEASATIILTGLFGMDGFSSSLLARRALKQYAVDTTGTGFVANAFLSRPPVKFHADNTNACQVLFFRASLLSPRNLSFIVGGVNLICSVAWALLIAFEGSSGKWYYTHSMPPSETRVAVIMAVIGIALCMDFSHLYLGTFHRLRDFRPKEPISLVWAVIILQILCIAVGSSILGTLGIKGFGRWVYSALQCLVWVKWAVGIYLLGECLPKDDSMEVDSHDQWTDNGILVYSSAFLLNAILAGVRGQWEYLPLEQD